MFSHSVLAFVGGLAVVYHLLKLVWRCCCGLGEFVLSAVWQVDLTTYGKWAGTVELKLDFKHCLMVCVCVAGGRQVVKTNVHTAYCFFIIKFNWLHLPCVCWVVVTGATSGIGKAYALEVSVHQNSLSGQCSMIFIRTSTQCSVPSLFLMSPEAGPKRPGCRSGEQM